MNKNLIKISIKVIFLLSILLISGCGISNVYKKTDSRKVPVNVEDRVKKNMEEGRGFRFSKGKNNNSGTFDFASSNELWRASMDILDFVPFANASYSGGILITDWFDGNSKKQNEKRDLKITVRFLTNTIRADALEIHIHERKCEKNFNNCNIKEIESKLESKIKLAILKRATFLKNDELKNKKTK